MKPFDPTKPCQTRDGRKVRILCTDANVAYQGVKYPIIGLIDGAHSAQSFTCDGLVHHKWPANENDLINIPEKRKLTGWVNVYKDGSFISSPNKMNANASAVGGRIACFDLSKYNIEYEEGEGL